MRRKTNFMQCSRGGNLQLRSNVVRVCLGWGRRNLWFIVFARQAATSCSRTDNSFMRDLLLHDNDVILATIVVPVLLSGTNVPDGKLDVLPICS